MENLDLLSRITPAFVALAFKWLQKGSDDKSYRHAVCCYSDLVLIGKALGECGGQWRLDLDDSVIEELLKAFQSRLPKRSGLRAISMNPNVEFSLLYEYANKFEEIGLGGVDACLNLDTTMQPGDDYKGYLQVIGRKVSLFHDAETNSEEKLAKFLTRVTRAKDHLVDLIYKDKSATITDDWNLERHPSHNIWKLTGKVHALIKDHWNCTCFWTSWVLRKRREARLNLSKYRILAPKLPAQGIALGKTPIPSTFEVLLPNYHGGAQFQWKVTTFEMSDMIAQPATSQSNRPRRRVEKDICRRLEISKHSQVDFIAEKTNLWHLQSQASTDVADHYETMESLHQLLGDKNEGSLIELRSPREKIILCYVLANSLLFLFPGPWLGTGWDSTKLYFNRHPRTRQVSLLALPYLSTNIEKSEPSNMDFPIEQLHYHPAVLSLGIMFLEIASGNRFTHSTEKDPCKQINTDFVRAREGLKEYERLCDQDQSKQLFQSFSAIISSCIHLKAPSDLPTNKLWEVGPIRYYILQCIVRPIAETLRDGYRICLEQLHNDLGFVPGAGRLNEVEGGREPYIDQQSLGHQNEFSFFKGDLQGPSWQELSSTRILPRKRPTSSGVANGEIQHNCLLSDTFDEDGPTDQMKAKQSKKWFNLHAGALTVVYEKHKSAPDKNVKVAILDSGIELSPDNQAIYNPDLTIEYFSFVDGDPEWQDDIGHGTHLATLLRTIAPYAIIHVARVFKEKMTPECAKNVADAIVHAVDKWQVDIIIMSFGFGKIQPTVSEAIEHAHRERVLLFAAASNDGNNLPHGIAWPASDSRVICVHSGDGYGKASSYTPDPQENMKIMVLGECIESAWPGKLKSPNDHKYMSGTSCAAPIAAGIAAVLLDYSQCFLSCEQWRDFHKTDSMRRMFRKLRADSDGARYWWIQLWAMFNGEKSDGWIRDEIRHSLGS